MALFVEHISTLSADITSVLKSKITEWIALPNRIYSGFTRKYLLGKLNNYFILRSNTYSESEDKSDLNEYPSLSNF